MAIQSAKIDILHAVDRGEIILPPDLLKIYSSARRLWFADLERVNGSYVIEVF